ncbi:uncharacterized protein LOC133175945 [Saccostrea echinata]|uniref:uncharacterized protein LOC133175945 n=1 Tax=Saccostrea echinata TaxID=191078 RepID=UPI002A829E81|nr:uncharacterized protein LOC133175945 [Saccostrea echinata]
MADQMSSDTSTSASCDLASPPNRSRKKRGGCLSKDDGAKKKKQSSRSSDTDYNWESKSHKRKTHVSSWTKERAETYGLFYEKKASNFSEFYDLFSSCKGKSRYGFIYPLEGEEKKLLESLVEQTDKMIEKHGVEMETGWEWTVAADWPFVWTKCCDAVRVLNESCRPAVYSGNHIRCYAALVNFYMALKDYVQEEIWRSNSCTPSDVPEGTYTELCAKFFEIFLLMSRRGEFRKSVMIIKDIPTSSIPDLRLTLSTSSPPSLFVVEVVEIKKSALASCVPFNIHQALDNRVLGQHAGELLLDFQLSVFRDLQAVFGIICMQTTLIFTCLKISTKHYQFIHDFGEDVVIKGMEVDDSSDLIKSKSDDEDEKDEYYKKTDHEKETTASTDPNLKRDCRKSGTIFYTKPYNYLISKDRKEMMEFLFWIGINCERVTVSSA